MWKRKSKEELLINHYKKRKTNRVLYVIYFIIIFIVSFIFTNLSGNSYRGRIYHVDPLNWSESMKLISNDLCIALFCILLIYFFDKNKHKIKKQTVICDRCNAVLKDEGSTKCKCGGELVNIDLMKWVEDDNH